MIKDTFVSPTALVSETVNLGPEVFIGRGAVLGAYVRVGPYSRVRAHSIVDAYCYLDSDVNVGPGVKIDASVLVLSGAQICPNKVRSVSTNGRFIGSRAIIGEDVLIHDEGEIGPNAIIPTQRTIASIGNFGEKNRVVTIYGSNLGPRYSIGCQVGVPFETIFSRVFNNDATTPVSANTYTPFLRIYEEIGRVVQKEYDKESRLVDELLAMQEALVTFEDFEEFVD